MSVWYEMYSAITRADLVEAVGAALPVVIEGAPGSARTQIETLAELAGVRITAAREPHQREARERFTAARSSPKKPNCWR